MVKMSTVWDRTAEFLSDHIGAVLPIALLAFFVPASISSNLEVAMLGAGPGVMLALRLTELALAVLSLWGSLTVAAMALDGSSGDAAGKIARLRLPRAFLVWMTLGIAAIAAIIVPVSVLLSATGHDLTAMAQGQEVEISQTAASTIMFYLLAAALAFLWIGARLVVTTPAIVREGLAFGAIRRSWSLTRGIAWRIIGVLILFAIVSTVSWLAANTVFGSIFALVAGSGADGVSLASVLTSIFTAAVQTAFMVLFPAFTAKLYLALAAQAALHMPVPSA
jgi:hypothetical protein